MSGNPTQSGTEKFQDGNVRVGVFREATKLFAAEKISGDTRKKWSDSQPPGDVSSPQRKNMRGKKKPRLTTAERSKSWATETSEVERRKSQRKRESSN